MEIDSMSLTKILSEIGGFKATITGIAFLTLSLFLFDNFLAKQAKIIRER